MASKGGREKIKLESTAGTKQKQKNHARKNVDHEVRPQSSQACRVQGNQTQVSFS